MPFSLIPPSVTKFDLKSFPTLCTPKLAVKLDEPELAIVIESEVESVVIVMSVPAISVNVSVLLSAGSLMY